MSDKDKTKNNKPEPEPEIEVPKFSIERLRRDCTSLFGVPPYVFDGAVYRLDGEFTVDEMKDKIAAWQKKIINNRKENK